MDAAGMSAYTVNGDNKAQMTLYSTVFTPSASSIRGILYTGSANNRTQYSNPEVDAMLDAAAAEVDAVKREALYKEIQEFISKDPPFFALFWRNNSIVAIKGIGGFDLPNDGLYDLRYIYKIV